MLGAGLGAAKEVSVDVHFLSDIAIRGAAETGQTEMVGYLLRHGADVHAKNDEPLQLAKKSTGTEKRQLPLKSG